MKEISNKLSEPLQAEEMGIKMQMAAVVTLVALGSAEAQEPDRRMVLHLANCYLNLQQYDLASQLYARVEELEEGKELVNYARALRMNREFRQSQLVLDRVLKHAHEDVVRAAEREHAFLLEDKGLWGQACKKWGSILNEPRLARLHRPAKAGYYEAYFRYGYCLFKVSQSRQVLSAGRSETFVNLAASVLTVWRQPTKRSGTSLRRTFKSCCTGKKN